ncbi:uncharacterized protein LOC113790461 [Dermatophagoides pteronyssinus]|uniref:uncharacterized protein LOC113790461 n=1 Tax=Dermatophagoides pteronyssinus TaxID=6956 RepID=UPI003F662006
MDNSETENLDLKYRKNFLYFLEKSKQNKSTSICFIQNAKNMTTDVNIEAYEPSLKHLAVSNLQTPIGLQKQVILRSNDIECIKFSKQ